MPKPVAEDIFKTFRSLPSEFQTTGTLKEIAGASLQPTTIQKGELSTASKYSIDFSGLKEFENELSYLVSTGKISAKDREAALGKVEHPERKEAKFIPTDEGYKPIQYPKTKFEIFKEDVAGFLKPISSGFKIIERVSEKAQKKLGKAKERIEKSEFMFISPEFRKDIKSQAIGAAEAGTAILEIPKGYAKGLREEPIKTSGEIAIAGGIGFAFGASLKTSEILATSKVGKEVLKYVPFRPLAIGTIKYGLPIGYGVSVAAELKEAETPEEKGKILFKTTKEAIPFVYGARLGEFGALKGAARVKEIQYEMALEGRLDKNLPILREGTMPMVDLGRELSTKFLVSELKGFETKQAFKADDLFVKGAETRTPITSKPFYKDITKIKQPDLVLTTTKGKAKGKAEKLGTGTGESFPLYEEIKYFTKIKKKYTPKEYADILSLRKKLVYKELPEKMMKDAEGIFIPSLKQFYKEYPSSSKEYLKERRESNLKKYGIKTPEESKAYIFIAKDLPEKRIGLFKRYFKVILKNPAEAEPLLKMLAGERKKIKYGELVSYSFKPSVLAHELFHFKDIELGEYLQKYGKKRYLRYEQETAERQVEFIKQKSKFEEEYEIGKILKVKKESTLPITKQKIYETEFDIAGQKVIKPEEALQFGIKRIKTALFPSKRAKPTGITETLETESKTLFQPLELKFGELAKRKAKPSKKQPSPFLKELEGKEKKQIGVTYKLGGFKDFFFEISEAGKKGKTLIRKLIPSGEIKKYSFMVEDKQKPSLIKLSEPIKSKSPKEPEGIEEDIGKGLKLISLQKPETITKQKQLTISKQKTKLLLYAGKVKVDVKQKPMQIFASLFQTDQFQRFKTKTDQFQRLSLLQFSRTKQKQEQKQEQGISQFQRLKSLQISIIKQKQEQKQEQKLIIVPELKSIQEPKLDITTRLEIKQEVTPFLEIKIRPRLVPPPPIIPFKFEETPDPPPREPPPTTKLFRFKFKPEPLEFFKRIKSKPVRQAKRQFKYTPSFTALTFGIRGRVPKKKELLTGLEIRPLPMGFNRASTGYKYPKMRL